MATESENLTAQESLQIIANMINEAKGNLQKNAFYYLFWGWIVAIANLAMFILFQMEYSHPYLAWTITIPAWIFTLIRMFTREKQQSAKTLLHSISAWLWLSYGVIIFSLVFFGWKINYQLNPVILMITALPTIVSGVMFKFKPLLWGGIFFWACGVISFFLPVDLQSLAGAVAITGGYLIPGYLLKKETQRGNDI